MVLRITNKPDNADLDAYTVSLSDFKSGEIHPFLATTKWEKIYVELCEDTPAGILRQVFFSAPIIPIYDRDNITNRVMLLLCEIYRNKAGELRKLYVQDRTAFIALLDSLN